MSDLEKIVEKIDQKQELTEEEIKRLLWETEKVYQEEGENRRWTRSMFTVVKVGNRNFAIIWEQGLTECQENEFYNQPYEVGCEMELKTITNQIWKPIAEVKNEDNGLIIVKQLPVIEEQLQQLSKEIDEKVNKANGLVCTEENKTVVKELRAKLNKEFAELETQRKDVKNKVLEPYNQFEKIYKENVSDKYKQADKTLKEKIDSIENQQKQEKENELKTYFYEYRAKLGIDFLEFESVNLNITLSASIASLEKQIEEFIDKVQSDLDLIETQENKTEILVEYKKDLNIARAIKDVVDRKKAVLEIEQKRVDNELEKEKQQIEQNLKQLNTQQELFEKIYTITFKVTGTAPKLKQLKEYLVREGYQYE